MSRNSRREATILAAAARDRINRRTLAILLACRVEQARSAGRTVDARADEEAHLVDEPSAQQDAVGDATAFEQEALSRAELAVQRLEREVNVHLRVAGDEIRHAVR